MSHQSKDRVPVAFDNKATKDFLRRIVDAEYRNHRSTAKALAAHTGGEATPRTAGTWVRGMSLPTLPAFMNMLVGPKPVPALQAEMRRLLLSAMDHEIDPDRALLELKRVVAMMEGK